MPESIKPAGIGHNNPPEPIESDPELRGLKFMRKKVRDLNESMEPYRIPIRERAKLLNKEKLLQDLQDYAQNGICQTLFKAFGANPTRDQIQTAREFIRNDLKFIADKARAFAMHHRKPEPYRVGGAMLALRDVAPGENPWVVIFDANTKVNENHEATPDAPKWCSEQHLLDRIKRPEDPSEANIYRVITITIVGEARPDDVSGEKGVRQMTLTPCKICRDRMVYDEVLTTGENIIIPGDTEIFTTDANRAWAEKLQTVNDLHKFHGEEVEAEVD